MLNIKKTPDFFVAMTSLDMSSHASPPPSLAAVLSVRCPRFLWAFCMLSALLYNFSRAFDIALPHAFHLLPDLLSCAIQDAFYSLSDVLCICLPHAFCASHTIPPPIISPSPRLDSFSSTAPPLRCIHHHRRFIARDMRGILHCPCPRTVDCQPVAYPPQPFCSGSGLAYQCTSHFVLLPYRLLRYNNFNDVW